MRICGIVCELNPFHKGHEYIFRKAKEITNSDFLVVVMSGDFVQRGIPAVCDKYSRAKMALMGGADLVIELPVIYSTASADYFAMGAISALNNLNCIDYLCFGSECGDIHELKKYVRNNFSYDNEAHILSQGISNNNSYRNGVLEALREGNSYVKAMSTLTKEKLSSNDMLGACYIKSLKILDSDIEPVALRRKGSGYLDEDNNADSASAIRKRILADKDFSSLVPAYTSSIIEDIRFDYFPIMLNDFSIQLFTRINTILRQADRDEASLNDFMDVSPNIMGRIKSNIFDFTSYENFVGEIHTKEYTKSRILRALTHILLDIRKDDYSTELSDCITPYIRILGFRRSSGELLSIIKENSVVPVISKAKDASRILDDEAKKIFDIDVYSANIYEQACAFKFSNSPIHDYSKEIVII